ncbi:MAG: 4Fe-4S dicluster domain-containing protein [bacterium]
MRKTLQITFFMLFITLLIVSYRETPPDWYKNIPQAISPISFIIILISGHTITKIMFISIVVVISAPIFGRIFCGYSCPLGLIIDTIDGIFSPFRRHIRLRPAKWLFSIKYIILITTIVFAIFGFSLFLFLDPMSIFTQLFTTLIFPFLNILGVGLLKLFVYFGASPFSDWFRLFESNVLYETQPKFAYLPFIVIIALIIIIAPFSRRGWCNYICPLGGLLSILGTFAPFSRRLTSDCTSCGVCERVCRMGVLSDDGTLARKGECILCSECQSICPENSIKFTISKRIKNEKKLGSRFLISRRELFIGTGIGLVTLLPIGLIKIKEIFIRPPGADSKRLDKMCLRCGLCLRVCPTNSIQYDLSFSSPSTLFTPRLVLRIGPCSYNCNLCGRICPSGAIPKLDITEKQKTKIGLAVVDRARCLSWLGETCMVCQEICPLPKKAILTLYPRRYRGSRGIPAPFVDENLCIGCGECEHICPVEGRSAIVVFPL